MEQVGLFAEVSSTQYHCFSDHVDVSSPWSVGTSGLILYRNLLNSPLLPRAYSTHNLYVRTQAFNWVAFTYEELYSFCLNSHHV